MIILKKHFFPSNEGYLITHGCHIPHPTGIGYAISKWVWYEDIAGERRLIKKFKNMEQAVEYVEEKMRTCGTCEN